MFHLHNLNTCSLAAFLREMTRLLGIGRLSTNFISQLKESILFSLVYRTFNFFPYEQFLRTRKFVFF
jgi:hypothetical protein